MIFKRRVNYVDVLEKLAGTIKDKTILDFGGGRGNLLHFANGKILENNYTCIDVDAGGLLEGNKEFLNANWIHWNRYHPHYNPTGQLASFPVTNRSWDIIWAHSVFTHLTIHDTISCLDSLLALKGKIIFSFISTTNNARINKLLKLKQIFVSDKDIENINNASYAVVLDKKNTLIGTTDLSNINYSRIWTFYTVDFLLELVAKSCVKHNRTAMHVVMRDWNWIVID
jgi:hypothetical protein